MNVQICFWQTHERHRSWNGNKRLIHNQREFNYSAECLHKVREWMPAAAADSTCMIEDIYGVNTLTRLRVALPFPEAIKGLCCLNSLPVIWLCSCKQGGTLCLHERRLQAAPLRDKTEFIPPRVCVVGGGETHTPVHWWFAMWQTKCSLEVDSFIRQRARKKTSWFNVEVFIVCKNRYCAWKYFPWMPHQWEIKNKV